MLKSRVFENVLSWVAALGFGGFVWFAGIQTFRNPESAVSFLKGVWDIAVAAFQFILR